ncbi:hypothetical protein NDU88_009618 [Pleurodeles waltl]|uniref:Uncharacterized protein n=1 Tax=Pleurodeles waltl TaxID=8319 RepID=A0AAV7RWL2_PLEWA|nr:hypothetical protein NDU88_009618 [Pleurodeles waltl]
MRPARCTPPRRNGRNDASAEEVSRKVGAPSLEPGRARLSGAAALLTADPGRQGRDADSFLAYVLTNVKSKYDFTGGGWAFTELEFGEEESILKKDGMSQSWKVCTGD